MKHPTLEDTIALARKAHAGQKDKAEADYIEHPLRVASTLADDDAKIVALLHDVLEDTEVTREYLQRSGYSSAIIEAIEALTKLPNEEGSDAGYEKFIRRAAKNPLARQVKIADLKDKMDLSRIHNPTNEDYARIEKYERALVYLEALLQDGSTPNDGNNTD
jgi:(p)ppGpp synthase/HD superfamily hydrolase